MAKWSENQGLFLLGVRRCAGCKEVKSLGAFHKRNIGRGKLSKDYFCTICRNLKNAVLRERTKANPAWYCRHLVNQIRHRAKVISVPFDLQPEDIYKLWVKQEGLCFYSGEAMNFSAVTDNRKSPHNDFPSLDRKVPKVGYVRDNVVWCKTVVNKMKTNLTDQEFIQFCQKVLNLHDK